MKRQTAFVFFLFIASSAGAQQSMRNTSNGHTSFFAEGGGPGILFSANVDKRFNPGNLGWGFRVGLGFVTAYEDRYDPVSGFYTGSQRSVATFPVQVNYIFGKTSSPHAFETGAGLTFLSKGMDIFNFYEDSRTRWFITTSFMYRRQPVNGGFSWRAGFSPLISSTYIQPFGALSVGYNF